MVECRYALVALDHAIDFLDLREMIVAFAKLYFLTTATRANRVLVHRHERLNPWLANEIVWCRMKSPIKLLPQSVPASAVYHFRSHLAMAGATPRTSCLLRGTASALVLKANCWKNRRQRDYWFRCASLGGTSTDKPNCTPSRSDAMYNRR